MPLPNSSSSYYLRNPFTQQYLTVSSTDKSYLIPSDLLAVNLLQQWRFPSAGPGQVYLQNVGTGQYFKAYSYNTNYNGYAKVTMGDTPDAVTVTETNGQLMIMVQNATTSNNACYIHDEGGIFAVTATYSFSKNELTRRHWGMQAVGDLPPGPMVNKNPLPKGFYRIRTFNGGYLLTMPDKAIAGKSLPYVSKQVPKNDNQKWAVTPQPNGYYTISSSGNGLYLAGSPTNLVEGATLIGQSLGTGDTAFQWNVQTFNPGVMFFIGPPNTELSIGFSSYQAENLEVVNLKTSDNIPSQIWFFETFKQIGAAVFHGKRLLAPGNYILEICQDNTFVKVLNTDDMAIASTQANGTKFTVIYADNDTPNFILSYTDASSATAYLTAAEERVETTALKKQATEWVLLPLQHKDEGIAYHICDASSSDPRKAISARMVLDRTRSFFALDPLAEQEVLQMWRFIDA
ncbi:hypothetical protein GALMADRAFT_250718 [Galerina marginata CBS 339.88]|uniref:Ricin B lectin domain-containing protein n=1 Tax=Galerina marginata (strain CBS 339.88) TaxID=685588 RepID=A0A067SVC6_GALM3|nr:hypothetical protein GALMADRAFT_250718 [Galerina marginata CBS 339.88]